MERASALGDAPAAAAARSPRAAPAGDAVARRVLAWLELARWPNALISAAGVALGAWWAGREIGRATALVMVSAVGLTALANAYNDRRDATIDAAAHPRRPIPSGRASARDAAAVAVVGATIAIVASALVSPAVAAATALVATLMVAYSAWLKPRGVVGNVAVALIASLPFVFGAWSVGAPGGATLLYALAVPLHFVREVAKDLDDVGADTRAARRTLPATIGVPRSRAVLAAVSIVFAVGATATFARGGLLGVALVAPSLVCCAAATARAGAGRADAPSLLKAAMVLAMLAAAVARAGRLL